MIPCEIILPSAFIRPTGQKITRDPRLRHARIRDSTDIDGVFYHIVLARMILSKVKAEVHTLRIIGGVFQIVEINLVDAEVGAVDGLNCAPTGGGKWVGETEWWKRVSWSESAGHVDAGSGANEVFILNAAVKRDDELCDGGCDIVSINLLVDFGSLVNIEGQLTGPMIQVPHRTKSDLSTPNNHSHQIWYPSRYFQSPAHLATTCTDQSNNYHSIRMGHRTDLWW